jgi:hypothetical protein
VVLKYRGGYMTVNELISLLENVKDKNVRAFLYDGGGDITEITPDMVDLSIDDRIDINIPALETWV